MCDRERGRKIGRVWRREEREGECVGEAVRERE